MLSGRDGRASLFSCMVAGIVHPLYIHPMPTEYYENKKISVELTLIFQCLSIIESNVIIIKTSILT